MHTQTVIDQRDYQTDAHSERASLLIMHDWSIATVGLDLAGENRVAMCSGHAIH